MPRPFLLELFCGTKSVSHAAERHFGMRTATLDILPKWKPTYCVDILSCDEEWTKAFVKDHGTPDIVWASPDCRHYSKIRFSMPHKPPDIDYADKLVKQACRIIRWLQPKFWIIENPYTGMLRRRPFMSELSFVKVTYCHYGFRSKKETVLFGTVDGLRLRHCNAKDWCEYKRTTGKHPDSIGCPPSQGGKELSRRDRLMVPTALVVSVLEQLGFERVATEEERAEERAEEVEVEAEAGAEEREGDAHSNEIVSSVPAALHEAISAVRRLRIAWDGVTDVAVVERCRPILAWHAKSIALMGELEAGLVALSGEVLSENTLLNGT
jgi:hypothetical protein